MVVASHPQHLASPPKAGLQSIATSGMVFSGQKAECCSDHPSSCGTQGNQFSGSNAYDRSEHSRPVASLSLLMNHADDSEHAMHRCLSLVTPKARFFRPRGLIQKGLVRIDQRSFAACFARFGVSWLSLACRGALAAGHDSKRPC